MPSATNTQVLPSFDLSLQPDYYRTMLPNLSYPSRSNAHIPWSGSSASLLFATTRPEMAITISTPIVQVPTTANPDTCSVPDAFQGISMLIWHNLSMIIRIIRRRLFGIGFTNSSATTSI